MMENRKLPFGYELRQGKICEHKAEADIVRLIYEQYAAGESYSTITAALSKGEVRYAADKAWNKNMIARIVKCEKYAGMNGFPRLIETRHVELAKSRTLQTGHLKPENSMVRVLRGKLRCAECGNPLARHTNNVDWECWLCHSCEADIKNASTPNITSRLMSILASLIFSPNTIRVINEPSSPPLHIRRLENDILRELDKPNCDESAACGLALALAAARYEQLGNEDYETERLRRIFEAAEPSAAQDAELLQKAASAILVYPNGEVALKLKNGQIIERT